MPEKCGKKNRAGGPCAKPAGWGTDHPGVGPCKLHGGATPLKRGGVSKEGRVTTKYPERIAPKLGDLVEKHRANPEPLNLLGELAEARAVAEWYQQKHGDDLEPNTAAGLIEGITRIVKRIEDIGAQNAISRPDLMRIMQEMGRVVAHYVQDEDTRQKIQDAWLQIRA